MDLNEVGWNKEKEVKRKLFDQNWRNEIANCILTFEKANELQHGLDRVHETGSSNLIPEVSTLFVKSANSDTEEEEGEERVDENGDDILYAKMYAETLTLPRHIREHSHAVFLSTKKEFTFKVMTSQELTFFMSKYTPGYEVMNVDLGSEDKIVEFGLENCYEAVASKSYWDYQMF
jgi:hypothetical protein